MYSQGWNLKLISTQEEVDLSTTAIHESTA